MKRAILLVAAILVGAASAAAAPKPKPAGTLVFYSQRTPDGGLYAESAAGGPLRLLQRGAGWPGAVWSPDGSRYLFQREPDPSAGVQLWIADANGRRARLLATKSTQESWSPEGRRIAFVRNATAIWTIGADGGGAREIVTAAGSNGFVADPTWSPDSRMLAFRGVEPGSNDSALMLVAAAGGAPRLLASCVYFAPVWAPRGNRVAYTSCGPTGRARETPGLYVQDVRSGARRGLVRDGTGPIAWSPDGRWIALAVAGRGLQIVHPDGTGLRTLAKADNSSTPAWAPDSRRIAIAYGQPSDVVVVGLDGHAVRVTQGGRYGYVNVSPTWQPRDLPAKRLGGSVVSPAIPTDSLVRGRVLEAMRPVESLAADGSRVAIDYGSGSGPAAAYPLIETWNPPAGQIVRFNAHGYQRPALAGTRVAVPQFSHAMGVNFYGIGLAATTHPNQVEAGGLCRPGDGPVGGPCIRDPLGDAVGHGSLLVFDSWKGPEPYCLRPCPPPKHDGRLYRVDGNAAVQIATSPLELTPLAVDGNRILVDAGAGTLAVLDRTGRTRLTLPAPAATESVLQGTDVVAHRGITLDDYDAATGALRHEWPIPADAVLEDVQSGIAVFVDGSAIHLLRLVDGRNAAINPAGSSPVHAQLEHAGLFYSYSVDDASRPGRVAFVPWASLPLRP